VKGGALPVKEGEESGLQKVIYNKYYIDEIYNAVLVKPILAISLLAYEILDLLVVDGLVNLTGRMAFWKGKQLRSLQSGNIGFYLIVMVLSVCAILGYVVWQI
jgi:NADH-quinone oxidoreductase subunit L